MTSAPISFPIYFLIVYCFMKPFERLNQEQMASNETLSSSIIEDINGIETIKSLTSEKTSYQKIDREFVDYLKKSFAHQKSEAIQNSIKQATQLIINVLVLWLGAKLVISNQISVGQLVTYNALLGYFTEPFQNIINLQAKLQTATVANQRLNKVYLVKSEFKKSESQELHHNNPHNIIVDDVSYQYGYQKNILHHFSIKIPFGEKIALVGVSGSGKSTLAKLLVHFISPSAGNIFIGEQNIKHVQRQNLRQHILYLPQNPYIFTGSILDNLTLGARENTTQEDILKAVELADSKDDIENMPQSYQTEISEEGGMSGGQKQRIALARALLSNSQILILDESTSNLDVATEKKIIDNLLSLKNKTIIFIAHRLTIAEKVQRVILLEKGIISEDGSHAELIHKKSKYYHLVKY
ncbi:peptide ABC transporter ATP-binding protein [Leuconostoc mesenteroides subsp. cremoris TIFN8]|nr:peptide ABC transporter ATP-binding protein [Leuconostoc mesenteroides subsp. cremoris TIFN8]